MASSLQNGINAAKAGRMQEALDFMKDAIIEEPQNADVWVWIAAIIDDFDKQEIFLKKALEIDPHNIPAQRGMAYLNKRKQDLEAVKDDHLSDHTSPISPFPSSNRPSPVQRDSGWSKLNLDEPDAQDDPAIGDAPKPENKAKTETRGGFFQNLPQLSLFEILLLGIVVIVFCVIGILAASALFDFDLPLGFLSGGDKVIAVEPPYPGTFLYENEIFFDIQRHEGLPSEEVGIPTSFVTDPVIVFYELDLTPNALNLIFETGDYVAFDSSEGKKTVRIQPVDLTTGLYCLQKPAEEPATQAATYWCFRVNLSLSE